MATVAPEVGGAGGETRGGVFRQPKDDGAGEALPLFAGTVQRAEGGLGVVLKRDAGFEVQDEHGGGRPGGQLAANDVIDIANVRRETDNEVAWKFPAEALDQRVAQSAVVTDGEAEGERAAGGEHHAAERREVGSLTGGVGRGRIGGRAVVVRTAHGLDGGRRWRRRGQAVQGWVHAIPLVFVHVEQEGAAVEEFAKGGFVVESADDLAGTAGFFD